MKIIIFFALSIFLFTTNIFAQHLNSMIVVQKSSFSQDPTEQNQNDDIKEYDMTGFVFSLGFFDYLSFGVGINSGKYTVLGGIHLSAFAYGIFLEYKTINEMIIRPYAKIYGGSGGMLLGISLMYATEFTASTVGFAPGIGIGFSKINSFYRYNFYFDAIYNCHEIVLVFYNFSL